MSYQKKDTSAHPSFHMTPTQGIRDLFAYHPLHDPLFQGDGGVVVAHKSVLAASCEYFSAMFTHQMSESKASEISLPGINMKILKLVIDFVYTCTFKGRSLYFLK